MPEGPEIRRMADDIGAAVAGKTAEQVFFAFDHYKAFEQVLAGRQVSAVEARGKAVLVFFEATDFDGPWCVYSHNQLYGKWRTGRSDREPDTNRQLRFAVLGANKAARLYRVFNREGQACHECDAPIAKTRVASRRLYYCPVCQAQGRGSRIRG